MKKIVVVDYGMGNLHSVMKAMQFIKIPAELSSKSRNIKKGAAIVLPGVGAFNDAMREIKKRKLYGVIKKEVGQGKPVLGVCLGMQLLFSRSSEFGSHEGFGFIKGKVERFKSTLKVPHIGWNEAIVKKKDSRIMRGIKNNAFFYFVHSYYAAPEDEKVVLTETEYGNTIFASGVESGNIFGFQFHPEKSGEKALKIYRNFYEIVKNNKEV